MSLTYNVTRRHTFLKNTTVAQWLDYLNIDPWVRGSNHSLINPLALRSPKIVFLLFAIQI